MKKIISYGMLWVCLISFCSPTKAADAAQKPVIAVAFLKPTEGNKVSGVLTLIETPEGVRVSGRINGLTPGEHGFHIHETGNCDSLDGSSAGGHFNPTGASHGSPMDVQKHAGDFGNILADDKGVASVDAVFGQVSLSGENSIVGRGVIVHAAVDDFKTQPTGNAGARVACGVIVLTTQAE